MDILGPLEFIYSWESISMALGIYSITRAIKSIMLLITKKNSIESKVVKYVLFPLVPLAVGFAAAILIPVHPQQIIDQANKVGSSGWIVYGCYGATVGQFADYVHQRVNGAAKIRGAKDEN